MSAPVAASRVMAVCRIVCGTTTDGSNPAALTYRANGLDARQAKGLSQEELADRAGLSARYLGSIERASVSASVTGLGKIVEALRVDAGDLIGSPQGADDGRSQREAQSLGD